MLTTLITEGSAKQLVITLLFTGITMIRLIGDRNVLYVSPAHSEILILPMEYLPWAKVTLIKKIGRLCIKKVFYMLEVLLEVKISHLISFIP